MAGIAAIWLALRPLYAMAVAMAILVPDNVCRHYVYMNHISYNRMDIVYIAVKANEELTVNSINLVNFNCFIMKMRAVQLNF